MYPVYSPELYKKSYHEEPRKEVLSPKRNSKRATRRSLVVISIVGVYITQFFMG